MRSNVVCAVEQGSTCSATKVADEMGVCCSLSRPSRALVIVYENAAYVVRELCCTRTLRTFL